MFADKLSVGVSIRSNFMRSVHLERDQNASQAYHLTESARQALAAVESAILRPSERALTLVGPYGSGKSAFCVYVAQKLKSASGKKKGLLPVLRVGARTPLGAALVASLEGALDESHPKVLLAAKRALPDAFLPEASPRAIADLFAFAAAETPGGILLILDEFGKFLEHAALHPKQTDPFLLQEIAEAAARSSDAKPLIVITVLHQNVEAYARGLSRREQAEWQKVAERFRQVAFVPSDQERLEMIAQAIVHEAPFNAGKSLGQKIEVFCSAYANLAPSLPAPMARLEEWMAQAYPLHPLTFLALPVLFRRVGQSHRSQFSFLHADEPFAFQRFLQETLFDSKAPPFFPLDRLFDYAATVLASGSALSREWAEAREAVDQDDAHLDADALCVLKAVALLGLLRDTRLPASIALLQAAYPSLDVPTILQYLESKQRIVFRRSKNSYRISEGGDLDVESAIQEARAGLLQASAVQTVAEQVCKAESHIARRHSYQTGTTRVVRFTPCTAGELGRELELSADSLTVFLALVENDAEREEVERQLTKVVAPNHLVVLAQETDRLREAALDALAATAVFKQLPELDQDRASRRELSARHAESHEIFLAEWRRLFSPLEEGGDDTAKFWFGGEPVEITEVGPFLSEMADATYSKTPRLRNELVNRRAVSSQAAAARRNLIEALIDPARVAQERLGIAGFPPERSMYESLLSATGLHADQGEGYRLFAPAATADPNGLLPIWQEMERLILDSQPHPIVVQDLFRQLSLPPFGLTDGVLPVLLCVFLQIHATETTFYREQTFVPEPGIADWELLLRRPEQFAIAGCRVSGERKAVVERLAAGLKVEPSTVAVVRALLRQIRSLPDYAQKTRQLSPEALRVRQAFASAKSPEQLLFVDLPEALGIEQQSEEVFFPALNAVFREWSAAFPKLVEQARDTLLLACGFPIGDDGFDQLRIEAQKLEPVLGFAPTTLTPFVRRAALTGDSKTVLDGLLAQVGDRPPRTWDDSTVERFHAQAIVIGQLFRELVSESGRFTEPELVSEEVLQRDRLVAAIRDQIGTEVPARLLRASLLQILRELP